MLVPGNIKLIEIMTEGLSQVFEPVPQP